MSPNSADERSTEDIDKQPEGLDALSQEATSTEKNTDASENNFQDKESRKGERKGEAISGEDDLINPSKEEDEENVPKFQPSATSDLESQLQSQFQELNKRTASALKRILRRRIMQEGLYNEDIANENDDVEADDEDDAQMEDSDM